MLVDNHEMALIGRLYTAKKTRVCANKKTVGNRTSIFVAGQFVDSVSMKIGGKYEKNISLDYVSGRCYQAMFSELIISASHQ